ncbi:MAG: hypothetical protein IK133_00570 [Clostridia bacterium]|nr:hypothetical protein [Clostridia bacterium]
MSAKNVDRHNRFRNITVGFRVSPEENEQLNRAVALSGLPKQEYCYRKCMNRDITVTPNPRIFKAMNVHMISILKELQRIAQGENPREELLEDITLIIKMLNDMKEERK